MLCYDAPIKSRLRGRDVKKIYVGFIAGLAAALLAAPGQGQSFSDSYTFLKAVRERDGNKVTDLLSVPGSAAVVINSTDRATGNGALHYVVEGRDYNWLAFLLGKGARADVQDNDGTTPLALTARIGWVEGAQLLVDQRASVDLANGRGETPLIVAVLNRNPQMARLLLAAGANPRKTDNVGYSALDYAKRDRRSAAIVKILEAPPASAKEKVGPSL